MVFSNLLNSIMCFSISRLIPIVITRIKNRSKIYIVINNTFLTINALGRFNFFITWSVYNLE